MPVDAQWVVPKFSCRVTYESAGEYRPAGRTPQWEEFLGNIR